MAVIEVTKFELQYEGQPVGQVGHLMFLKVYLEYAGGTNGIQAGDTISVKFDNAASEILKILGMGNNTVDIHGDEPIGKVGTRTFRNEDGNFYLDVLFDSGYSDYYGDDQPSDIAGWLETSVYVEYKEEVPEPGTTEDIAAYVNGVLITITVDVKPGGGGEPQTLDTPGVVLGKSWRYGNHSGNLVDLPEVPDNDYSQFEVMRWNVTIGTQNLTWRDLRATNGNYYYTTDASLVYSHNNPTGNRYQSDYEDYIARYAVYFHLHVDSPYHYTGATLRDYLAVGNFNSHHCSAHEYVRDSLRIIRILGREQSDDWWGKSMFRVLADSNFLVEQTDEPVDRFLPDLFFKGKRGLNIAEFLVQMHAEGQLLDKATPDDILRFEYVYNGESPFSDDPDDKTLIPSFTLDLGDLRFGNSAANVNLVGTDNAVKFADVPAANLPCAYWVYYDTNAVEAVMDSGYFYYFNAVKFNHRDGENDAGSTDLWIKLEDDSGGSGHTTEVRIRKVDEQGGAVRDVLFTLIHENAVPPKSREARTTINGTASFTLPAGEYSLKELLPPDSGLTPVADMRFTVTDVDNLVNLRALLEGTDYPDIDLLDFSGGVNVITNRRGKKEAEATIIGRKSAVGRQLRRGQFEFALYNGEGKEIARVRNGESETPIDIEPET